VNDNGGLIVPKETTSQYVEPVLKLSYFPVMTLHEQNKEAKRRLYNQFSDICIDGNCVFAC
jgi:hypothetical protein